MLKEDSSEILRLKADFDEFEYDSAEKRILWHKFMARQLARTRHLLSLKDNRGAIKFIVNWVFNKNAETTNAVGTPPVKSTSAATQATPIPNTPVATEDERAFAKR